MGWNNDDWDGDGPAHAGDIATGSVDETQSLEGVPMPDGEEPIVSPVDIASAGDQHEYEGEHPTPEPPPGVQGVMNTIWSGNGKYVVGALIVIVIAVIVYKWRK